MFLSPWDEMFLTVPATRAPQVRPCRRSRTPPVRIPKRPLWIESSINGLDFKIKDDGREGFAAIKLPRGVACEDVELDFTEATRTLTVRLGSWSQRFKLTEGFDTTKMQADFDPIKCELRLQAPRLQSGTCRARSTSETSESDEGFTSGYERSRSSSPESPREAPKCVSQTADMKPRQPEVIIEDVGPEEELDY